MAEQKPNNSISELAEALTQAINNANTNRDSQQKNASTIAVEINQEIRKRSEAQANFARRIATEMRSNKNTVTVTIPQIYREYQPTFTATLNGCTVSVPADGVPRTLHKDFAVIIIKRLRHLDEKIAAMRKGMDNRELIG